VSALEGLVTELARLPGIGRKTAQRLALHLIQQPGDRLGSLSRALTEVSERVRPCAECGHLAESERCEFCEDPRRDRTLLCVVEDSSAVLVLERAGEYHGRYHVLGGRLDPLAGVGPEDLRIEQLVARVAGDGVQEVILATNPSMEGEVTATYVQQRLAGMPTRVTRLARGLPVGGDLEYVDGVTLAHALSAREPVR
jgi:recombination protein RecR